MTKETGGPAFPWCGDLNDCPAINLGMTLRDYFAAKAISSCPLSHPMDKAAWAYKLADAMIAERGKA